MILAVRTDSPETQLFLLDKGGKEQASTKFEVGRQLSNQLLVEIEKLLEENSSSWGDLSGVIVYEGPGSFTGLRLGISTANAIAYAEQIPVVGASGDGWLAAGLESLTAAKPNVWVAPRYGADPHITKRS